MDSSSYPSVCIVGSGPAGLITAHTLLQDGLTNVTVFTRDKTAGGVWAMEKLYPGMRINNVHGEYKFSSHPMPPPTKSDETGGRLSGADVQAYLQSFVERHLKGKIKYQAEVQRIRRGEKSGWQLTVQDLVSGDTSTLHFDKLVLCSGGCSEPKIPENLSQQAANQAGFLGPVVHSIRFTEDMSMLMDAVKPLSEETPGHVLVIGGGKSAQDIAGIFAASNRKVSVVYEMADSFNAANKPMPDFIRQSRMGSMMVPNIELRTWQERFLHTTSIGSYLVRSFWSSGREASFGAYGIPPESPLRNTHQTFWTVHANDEGLPDPQRFYSLANSGKIDIYAPTRALRYSSGSVESSESPTVTVEMADGRAVTVNAIVLCTGYASSWTKILDDETRKSLGLNPVPVPEVEFGNVTTLNNPPVLPHKIPDSQRKRLQLYRGMVPAENIYKRDFAINGSVYSSNFIYVTEVQSHWISSYLLGDPFLKLPTSLEETKAICDKYNAWWYKRYTEIISGMNESVSGAFPFFNWPQHADKLLEDMGLQSWRSGGNWLTWPFQIVSMQEIEHLSAERAAKRAESHKN